MIYFHYYQRHAPREMQATSVGFHHSITSLPSKASKQARLCALSATIINGYVFVLCKLLTVNAEQNSLLRWKSRTPLTS